MPDFFIYCQERLRAHYLLKNLKYLSYLAVLCSLVSFPHGLYYTLTTINYAVLLFSLYVIYLNNAALNHSHPQDLQTITSSVNIKSATILITLCIFGSWLPTRTYTYILPFMLLGLYSAFNDNFKELKLKAGAEFSYTYLFSETVVKRRFEPVSYIVYSVTSKRFRPGTIFDKDGSLCFPSKPLDTPKNNTDEGICDDLYTTTGVKI